MSDTIIEGLVALLVLLLFGSFDQHTNTLNHQRLRVKLTDWFGDVCHPGKPVTTQ